MRILQKVITKPGNRLFYRRWYKISILAIVLVLSSCGWFSKDNTRVPTELEEIEQTVTINQAWSKSAGDGIDNKYLKLYPKVVEDRLFVVDAEGEVTAIGLEDGQRLWQVSIEDNVSAGLNGSDTLLVLGTEDGDIIALKPEDGLELWRTRLSSEIMALTEAELGVVVARTNDSRLYGLDTNSGTVLWQTGRKTPVLTLRGVSVPVVSSGKLVVGFDDGKLAVFSMIQGQVQWQTTLGSPSGRSELERMVDIDGEIKVKDGIIFTVGFHSRVAALTLIDGRVLWSREISSYTGLDVDRQRVYVVDEDSEIWAFDRRTGASLWKQDKLKYRKLSAPVAIQDYIMVGDYEGYIHWMSKADGSIVARTGIDSDGISVRPLVVDGRVYVYGNSGKVEALDVAPLDLL